MPGTIQHVSFSSSLLASTFFLLVFFLFFLVPHVEAVTCHQYDANAPLVAGFGAPYDVFTGEMMMTADCTGNTVAVEVGTGNSAQYVYRFGYVWNGSTWDPFALTGTNLSGDWLNSKTSGTLTAAPPSAGPTFFVAYVCTWDGFIWKCGCVDAFCTTPHWQLQAYQTPQPQTNPTPTPNPNPTFDKNGPYPDSPVIEDISWDGSIKRLADGSDTFPATWGDDDALYTAYADGNGFRPFVNNKLSLGIGKVIGDPPNITGTNIRSNAERTGNGKTGEKGSGMLMVDGVLYMWVRNADRNGNESALWTSSNRGQSWNVSSVRIRELGYMTFINYGRNYAGARDNYVYAVSHNNRSAYNSADGFVLMRVPKDQITNQSSYEWYVRTTNGIPEWSSDISDRGLVFEHPGRSRRSGISYNAGLGRYLWWQMYDENIDHRFEGGFGVYDAPEPWGPWTTAYFTKRWDEGPGETGSFPPKWMSADGKTVHLLFSGDDTFSVRKATIITK